MTCNNRTLAQIGPFQIQSCNHCDSLSLHMHAITLRLDARAMKTLHQVIGRALAGLAEHSLEETHSTQPDAHGVN